MNNQVNTTQPDISGMKRVLRPQGEWEWPIAVYLYLAGMGGGAFAVGLLTYWLVHPDIPSAGMLLWGPLLVALGAPFLILDLGKKTRFINAAFNPWSSWAARGFVILSSLIVTGLLSFALALLPDLLPALGMEVPMWMVSHPALVRTVEIIALALSFATGAYTGVFLKSVRYVSLWNTWALPALFSASALSTGAMALIVFLLGSGLAVDNQNLVNLTHTLIPVELGLIVVEGAALGWLLAALRRAGQTPAHTIRHIGIKSSPSLVLALVLLVVALLGPSPSGASTGVYASLVFVSGALVLAGGFLLRHDFVKTGTKDEHPLHKMASLQYDWKTLAQPRGPGSQPEGPRDG